MLTDYTTYAEIRAALGVSDEEIDDATLGLNMYERGLVADLEDINTALPASYATILAKAENVRTASETAVFEALQLFAPFAIAKQLASSLPLFSPKQISDGKAGFSRYADSPYKETIKTVEKLFDRYRARLETKYAAFGGGAATTVVRDFGGAASPTTDPVTG